MKNKKFKQLRLQTEKIAKWNGKKLDQEYRMDTEQEVIYKAIPNSINEVGEDTQIEVSDSVSDSDQQVVEFSVMSELKNPTTVVNLVIVTFCFIIVSFNYYMISIYLKYIGGNLFINIILSTLAEAIAYFTANFFQKLLGTRIWFMMFFAMAAAFGVPLMFVTEVWIIAICVFISKFGISAVFMLAYYVITEIFPPLFVPFSFTVSNVFSRIITILAPQVAELSKPVPIILYCAACWGAIVGTAFLRKPATEVK